MKIIEIYKSRRELISTILGFLVYIPLAAIDYKTDSEIRFSLLYLVPIYLVTRNSGRALGFVICLLSIMPPLIDRIREAQFVTAPIAFYWNIMYKLAFFLIVAHLIFKKKIAEDQLRLKAQELARSNADLDQFASIASHDLQEPLRTISSYLQLLEHRCKNKLDAEAKEFIDIAVDGAQRMSALIKSLLEYSRLGKSKEPFKRVDCSAVLKRVLGNLKVAAEESGAVIKSEPLPPVTGAEIELAQLFQNLIGNAIKFRGKAPPVIQINAWKRGSHWVFVVEDNGIGIEPQYRNQIFNMFQRLHGRDAYEGTGIGLAVCKKIVERHGGQIWVESEPGKGSKFWFTLAQ